MKFTSNGNGTCYVSGIGTCTDTALVIPRESPVGDCVTTIGYDAFSRCKNLKTVYYEGTLEQWCNISFDSSCYYGVDLYINGDLVDDLVIPSTVTKIKKYAFYGCTSLASVTIPDGVTSIYHYTFGNCTKLTSIDIPDTVTKTDNSVFSRCSSLTSVTFEGTTEQWNAIAKGGDWNDDVPATTVICSDGIVAFE